jgi:predicted nucleic acid-binding protein
MNVFIDTNIYLTFYHYSSDDLEELKKLSVAIKSKDIKLYLTEQVKNEFKRNRETKIADALKRFYDQKVNRQFPQICKEYEEYKHLRQAIKQYEESKDKIYQQLLSDTEQNSLGADTVIDELFGRAQALDFSDKLLAAATVRVQLGNPPGKKGSYGDAINWETLLDKMPKEDLYLITDDADYISPINEDKLAQFLVEEWTERKRSNIFFYRKLSEFFRDKFPSIKLASELEKELAIANLVNSGNFRDTHAAIGHLSKFTDFTASQFKEIADAAISNSQITWISDDADVREFMQNLVRGKEADIDPEKLKLFEEYYLRSPEPAKAEDEVVES